LFYYYCSPIRSSNYRVKSEDRVVATMKRKFKEHRTQLLIRLPLIYSHTYRTSVRISPVSMVTNKVQFQNGMSAPVMDYKALCLDWPL
jgi:hypothetical protein